MDQTRWLTLMEQLILPPSLEAYQQLWSAYSEPHRHYHTVEHIADCLHQLDQIKNLAKSPAEVELALWFHDAIYNPKAQDNEAQSATWAVRFLDRVTDLNSYQKLSLKNHTHIQKSIHRHIMATQHHGTVYDQDTSLVVDIDLSILGCDTEQFQQFEQSIREEYKWVPKPIYCQKRRAVLSSFLERPTIYGTPYFQKRYESIARQNLETAIAKLAA